MGVSRNVQLIIGKIAESECTVCLSPSHSHSHYYSLSALRSKKKSHNYKVKKPFGELIKLLVGIGIEGGGIEKEEESE